MPIFRPEQIDIVTGSIHNDKLTTQGYVDDQIEANVSPAENPGNGSNLYLTSSSVIVGSVENNLQINFMATQPYLQSEATKTGLVNNSTVAIEAYLNDQTFGTGIVYADLWTPNMYVAVDQIIEGYSSSMLINVYEAISSTGSQNYTTSGSGEYRNFEIYGIGSAHFVNDDADSDPTLSGYVQTVKGLYQISGVILLPYQVVIKVPTAYINELVATPFKIWRYKKTLTLGALRHTGFKLYSKGNLKSSFLVDSSSYLGLIIFAFTTNIVNTAISYKFDGTENYSNVHCPLISHVESGAINEAIVWRRDLISGSDYKLTPKTNGDNINIGNGSISNIDNVAGYLLRFLTYINESIDQNANYYVGSVNTLGDCWQSFTAGNNNYLTTIWFSTWGIEPVLNITYSIYQGEGTSGALLYVNTITIDIVGDLYLYILNPVKQTSGQKYTIRMQGTGITLDTSGTNYSGGLYNGGTNNLTFRTYTSTGLELSLNKTNGNLLASTLAIANGIVQSNSSGLLSSSTVLPNGTTATKQTFGNNTNLLATTSFIQDAIEAENFWDRVGTTLYARNSGDNINILSGCFSNIDNPADANLRFEGSAETIAIQQTTFNASESTGGDGWQSFTAVDSNFVTKISIRSYGTSNPQTISILSGEGTGGTVLYTFAPTTLAFEWTDLAVTIPFPISIGQKYTIRIVGTSFSVMTWYGPPGPYAGGSWKGSNNSDLAFKVWTTGISANMILQRSNGRMGVGTLAPSEILDVVGKIKSSDTIYAPLLTATTQVNSPKITNVDNFIIDAVKSTAGNSTVSLINSATSRYADVEIDGNLRVGALYTSAYRASVQSPDTDTWLEILNNTGAGNGVFFGVTGNNFELYNYQATPGNINFYLRDTLTWQMLNTGAFGTPSLTLGTTQNVTQILTETTWASPTNSQLATKLATKTYISGKVAPSSSYNFIAVKNANQSSVTGDGTFVQVTYGDEKIDVGNNFDGTYFVAPANCAATFIVSNVFDIAAGTNTWYSINLRRVNSSDVLQETVTVDYGLISDNLDILGNANLLGKSSSLKMNSGDKVSVYLAVAGNATKNISITSYNYQRFSGFVTALL